MNKVGRSSSFCRRRTGVTSDLHSGAAQTHLPGARVVGLYRGRQLLTHVEFQHLTPRLEQTKRDAAENSTEHVQFRE